MKVENFLDDLWIGVKCQSNLEISGSLRNRFRASLRNADRGRALFELGASPRLPNSGKLRMLSVNYLGVRMWGISFMFKRETAQTVS